MESPVLTGFTILIVEDEPLIQLDLVQRLECAGATVVRAADVRNACKLIDEHAVSAALLDVNLGDTDCSGICEQLSGRGVRFCFHTGYSVSPVFQQWPDAVVIPKPTSFRELVSTLATLCERDTTDARCTYPVHQSAEGDKPG